MKTLEEQFVPYQPSFDMKELGFNEPCFGYYNDNKFGFFPEIRSRNTNSEFKFYPTAPTFSQAFDFFEEKYKLYCTIEQYNNEFFFFRITDMVIPRRFEEYPYELLRNIEESTTKKEAMLKAVLKLIEIVKNKK